MGSRLVRFRVEGGGVFGEESEGLVVDKKGNVVSSGAPIHSTPSPNES